MFSPSQLIQSVMQRSAIQTPKPVELTPGQVFKGTVIKQYPDNMALVQIGGLQVQAKMEAKLEPGQKAWLQVQPSTDVVTLKVLETTPEGAGKEATLEGLMRSLGLPETKEGRAIVTALLNANLPVNKGTVQAFMAVAQRLGMDDATLEAFMLAAKRNLPLTPDSVAGLKTFMSAKPIDQVIQHFRQQASLFLDNDGPAKPHAGGSFRNDQATVMNNDLRQVVSQLKERLAALPVLVSGQSETNVAEQTQPINRSNVPPPPGQNAVTTGTGNTLPATSNQATAGVVPGNPLSGVAKEPVAGNQQIQAKANDTLQQNVQAGPSASSPAPGSAFGQGMAGRGSTGSEQVNQPLTNVSGTRPSQEPQQALGMRNAESIKPVIPETVKANVPVQGNGSPAAPPAPAAGASSNPITELFRQLGLGHERGIMAQTLSGGALEAGVHKQLESVKSLLLQISQAPPQSVPHALREAADQLLQQVTGQQLMMLQPSNQTLSQLVMQIPIRTDQGDDTAFVQIESKKKDGGQVDAENCRLFFHLELKSMGTTMIDVSIVNRIVNLQIFNDAPWVEPMISGMKDSFAVQLQDVGYHLSAMRVQPVPDERSRIAGQSGAKRTALTDYKGVDLRV
ncbi:hypothetical protein [uncultured Brevibacillus sp.]|uniref:hypothetical protein n=1 Tax=uncultured Brevibacillus sp. TaxID=169970 RepID=UPI0025985DD1|nr:hypothetical protein [uncultured Brevibacillus sp.]